MRRKRRGINPQNSIERMDKMTELFIQQTKNSIYTGESVEFCEECGERIPENRRKAIACRYCLTCKTLGS